MGIIDSGYYDAFLSYARDDNILHDDAVRVFQRFLKSKFEAQYRLLSQSPREAEIFMDVEGLPANGDLSSEIHQALDRAVFLVIFVGKAYPNSAWCGKELQLFIDRFSGSRKDALERTFIIVLDKATERKDWGCYLEHPQRPIFERFYDQETGRHIRPMLEDIYGQAVPGPRFLGGIRKVVETMADRATRLNFQPRGTRVD